MAKIEFLPSRKSVDVPTGTALLDAARQAGVELESPCGGKGTCGKCLVRIKKGEVDALSIASLTPKALADGYVQACKTQLKAQDVVVEIDEAVGKKEGKFIKDDETHMVRSALLSESGRPDPLAVKWSIEVPQPKEGDGLGDVERLIRAVKAKTGQNHIFVTLGVMRELAEALRMEDGLLTVTLQGDRDIIGIESGDSTTAQFGVAVDLGTTTVVVQIVDLVDAGVVATRSGYNSQIVCGSDIISRINYAQKPERLKELQSRAQQSIDTLIKEAVDARGIDAADISNVSVSCNTTMVHLLLGLSPEHIRLSPYTPTVLTVPGLTAGQVGIDVNPDAEVCFGPCVGSYVGGDITSGLLATDIAKNGEALSLFIDVGTNGEIVLGNDDFLLGCACSAGPAFEGGGIKCGVRASLGAIETVDVDAGTGMPRYETIGDAAPTGICGSGMISLLANLFSTGWIDPKGKLNRDRECVAIRAEGRHGSYLIVKASDSGTGKDIFIDEIDIENIIRAKAAIYSACSLLLKEVGTDFDSLETITIAGGFGRSLDLEKAIVIGLLADLPHEKFRFIGNASLLGSYLSLVSKRFGRLRHDIANRMTYIDLSCNPHYMDQYTAAIFLPHTDPAKFPSVRVI